MLRETWRNLLVVALVIANGWMILAFWGGAISFGSSAKMLEPDQRDACIRSALRPAGKVQGADFWKHFRLVDLHFYRADYLEAKLALRPGVSLDEDLDLTGTRVNCRSFPSDDDKPDITGSLDWQPGDPGIPLWTVESRYE